MKNPLISIIIVNWNGKKFLKDCFDSLYKQSYKDIEVIFVDNSSKDDSVDFIKKNYSKKLKLKIIVNKKNYGFAKANNIGARIAKGEFLLLLNNDTKVEKNAIGLLLNFLKENPRIASVQPKITRPWNPNLLDVIGAYWTSTSFLYYYGYGKNSNNKIYNIKMPFFSNKGACMLIRKKIVELIGLFDEDFWCYYEETDFCNRVWISGHECWYYPKAKIFHFGGGTSSTFDNAFIQFHNFKNKLLSFLKNFELFTLIKIIPIYVSFNILLSLVWLFQGKWKHFLSIYKSFLWNFYHIKETLQKRNKIQSLRKKTDKEIFKITLKNPKISYYYYLFTNLEKYKDA